MSFGGDSEGLHAGEAANGQSLNDLFTFFGTAKTNLELKLGEFSSSSLLHVFFCVACFWLSFEICLYKDQTPDTRPDFRDEATPSSMRWPSEVGPHLSPLQQLQMAPEVEADKSEPLPQFAWGCLRRDKDSLRMRCMAVLYVQLL